MLVPVSRQHSLKYSTSVKNSSRDKHTGTLPRKAADSAPSSPHQQQQQQQKGEDEESGDIENKDPEVQDSDACGPLYASTTIPVNTLRHIFPESAKKTEETDPLEVPELYEQMHAPKKSTPPDPVYGNVTSKNLSKAPDFYVNYPKRL